MKQSFYLRNPKSKSETLILFTCFFNDEKKKFVYSTRECILPSQWDFKNRKPFSRGKNVSQNQLRISKTLRRYTDEFYLFQTRCQLGEKEFTSNALKEHLDMTFGNVSSKDTFFDVYQKFIDENLMLKVWKHGTYKRYNNIRNLLLDFEKDCKYKLTFTKINKNFYVTFTNYCYEHKNHTTNTFSRNMGLVKSFMYWAYRNKYHYNNDFENFKKPSRNITRQEVLSLEQIQQVYSFYFDDERLGKSRDLFVFQCLTGMRYGELKLINKRIINDQNCIVLKEEKDSSKQTRQIPLSTIPLAILMKYNYTLPVISNQKQNDYVKEILEHVGLTHEVEFTLTKGVEQKLFVKKYNERISTHSARRSFITIMRTEGIPDKVIMSITGHKDLKTFNIYHQVEDTAKISAVHKVLDRL